MVGRPQLIGSVREAAAGDAVSIAPILRAADRQECIAHIGLPPEKFLPGMVALCELSFAQCANDGRCIGLFGAHPMPGFDDVGQIWMVATDEMLQYSRQLLREGGTWIDRLHERFHVLTNLVDARNTTHIRWIKWSGFTLLATQPHYGAAGIPFIEFVKVK